MTFLQKWINALRSGEYPQCKMVLKNAHNQFSPAGVAMDLWVKEGHGRWIQRGLAYAWIDNKPQQYSTNQIYVDTMHALGINEHHVSRVSELSEHSNYNFSQIADWLENNVKELQ